jgi:flagellar biosynthetic protein FliR
MIEDLPRLAFQAVLLLSRIGACGMVLPGLGEAEVPAPVRLALVLALVVLLLPGLAPLLPPPPDDAAQALRLIGTEIAIGLWLGWLARLLALALTMAGQAIGFLVGLSSLLTPDAALGGQNGALARLLGLSGTVLLLSSGLYALPLRALAESYAVLPAASPLPAGLAAEALATAGADSLSLALRLMAPVLLLSLIGQAAAGLLARAAPQAQVFVLVGPAQVLAGLALLALLMPALLAHWAAALRAGFAALPGLG